MTTTRKRYSAEFKAHVAFEACKENRTLAQLSSEFGVSSEQICRWKKRLQADAKFIFGEKQGKKTPDEITAPLYQEIGRLKMELDWMKKQYPTIS